MEEDEEAVLAVGRAGARMEVTGGYGLEKSGAETSDGVVRSTVILDEPAVMMSCRL